MKNKIKINVFESCALTEHALKICKEAGIHFPRTWVVKK